LSSIDHIGSCCRLLLAVLLAVVLGTLQAAPPTLEALRARIASDRVIGLAEGWQALEAGWFDDQPEAQRSLLWFMGGAAVGGADDPALERIVTLLDGLGEADPIAASLAGFLRGSRLLSLGQEGEGLIEILQAANAVIEIDDPGIQRIASGELCRGYTMAGRLDQALVQCRRQTHLIRALDDPPALAAAEHAEAVVLSYQGDHRQAAALWRSARERFSAVGMPELASRLAGSLATALLELGEYSEAFAMAAEAHQAALASGSPTSIALTGEYLGSALIGLGRHEEAVAVLEQSLAALSGISFPQIESSVLRALALEVAARESEQREAALRSQRKVTLFAVLALAALIVASIALALLLRSQRRLSSSLHAQAYRDPLTKLANRRAFTERATALVKSDSGSGKTHCLMIVDLDHFKRINDQGGHPLGDDVLVSTARCLIEVAPSGTMVARLGGEEFAVLCPDTDAEAALALAEKLRQAIARLQVELDGKPLQVTASIGIANLSGSAGHDLSSWMKRADLALYAAKSDGRNRVETFDG